MLPENFTRAFLKLIKNISGEPINPVSNFAEYMDDDYDLLFS